MGDPLRIIFMGTPDFSIPALEALIASHHHVVGVYSQPARPSGRGHKVIPSPVHQCAARHDIPVFTPLSLRSAEEQQHFIDLAADVAIVAAYGLILPKAILDAPRYGCINIHGSLLPRWRGAAPIQRAIQAGDVESGITLMQMDVGLDTGDMLVKAAVPITPETTGQSLHDTLSILGAELLLPFLEDIENRAPEPQNEDLATYAAKLSKEESHLDFTKSAQELDCQIRAFTPWPGSYIIWRDRILKVLKASVDPAVPDGLEPGMLYVRRGHLGLVCADGVLSIDQVQLPGKKPQLATDFIHGYSPQNGEHVGRVGDIT